MEIRAHQNHIIIAPQIYVSLEPLDTREQNQDIKPRQTEIPMTWSQFEDDFRLDIDLPESSVLDVVFAAHIGVLHVNGETIWENNTPHAVGFSGAHAELTPAGLRLTCTSGGSIHILARCIFETGVTSPKNGQVEIACG